MPKRPERFALFVEIVTGGSAKKARGKLPSLKHYNAAVVIDDRADVCRDVLENLAIIPYQVHSPPHDRFDPTSFNFGSDWLTLCRMHYGQCWPMRSRPNHVAQRSFAGAVRVIADERCNGQLDAKIETADGLLRKNYNVDRSRNAVSCHPAPLGRRPAGAR